MSAMEGGLAHSGPVADEATTLLDVLGLVLQHSDLLQRVQDFCRLLETSRAVAAAAQQAPGRLDVRLTCTANQAAATVPWLARHGQSIGLLVLKTLVRYQDDEEEDEEEEEEEDPVARDQRLAAAAQEAEEEDAAEAALVAALQQAAAAAAAAPGLQLRELNIGVRLSAAVQLVQLSGRQLTRLIVWPWNDDGDVAGVALLAAAVAALPGLEQLELKPGAQQLLAGLAGSSSLTQLKVDFPHPSQLPGLPSQLQELELVGMHDRDPGCALQLRHCTALKRLEGSGLSLEAQDELPDSLVKLEVCGISFEPLLGLKQLRELSCLPPPALELRRLSQLTSLSRITLSCWHHESMAASAEAWPMLPGLLELRLSFSTQGDPLIAVMQHLSKATRVDKLSVSVWRSALVNGPVCNSAMMAAMAGPLAAALPSLSQLRDFEFITSHAGVPRWHELNPVQEADVIALAAAVAGLPSLQHLRLSGLPWGLIAPPFAAAGTQLTSLSLFDGSEVLEGTEVLDVDLSRMFCGLTGIRALELGKAWSTDEVLVAAADHLQQLTRLAAQLRPPLRISVKGLQQLLDRMRLRKLELYSNLGRYDWRRPVAAACY